MPEDEVCGTVSLGKEEELVDALGGDKDLSPRKAPCLCRVLGHLSSVKNFGCVVAGGFLVRLNVVFLLFRAVAFTKVVARSGEIGCSILDRLNVGGSTSEIEDSEGLLESVWEDDDGMEVDSLNCMFFLAELNPVVVIEGVEEVGEFIGVDVISLRPSKKKSLSVCSWSRHEKNAYLE